MEPPSHPFIEIVDSYGVGPDADLLPRAVEAALARHGIADRLVTVLLTDDDEIRGLNHRFRGVESTTDVLTFPTVLPAPEALGELAISVPVAQRQATFRGATLGEELQFLAIHGALHLAGLDDELPDDRDAMVAEMNAVAVSLGLAPDQDWHTSLYSMESVTRERAL